MSKIQLTSGDVFFEKPAKSTNFEVSVLKFLVKSCLVSMVTVSTTSPGKLILHLLHAVKFTCCILLNFNVPT